MCDKISVLLFFFRKGKAILLTMKRAVVPSPAFATSSELKSLSVSEQDQSIVCEERDQIKWSSGLDVFAMKAMQTANSVKEAIRMTKNYWVSEGHTKEAIMLSRTLFNSWMCRCKNTDLVKTFRERCSSVKQAKKASATGGGESSSSLLPFARISTNNNPSFITLKQKKMLIESYESNDELSSWEIDYDEDEIDDVLPAPQPAKKVEEEEEEEPICVSPKRKRIQENEQNHPQSNDSDTTTQQARNTDSSVRILKEYLSSDSLKDVTVRETCYDKALFHFRRLRNQEEEDNGKSRMIFYGTFLPPHQVKKVSIEHMTQDPCIIAVKCKVALPIALLKSVPNEVSSHVGRFNISMRELFNSFPSAESLNKEPLEYLLEFPQPVDISLSGMWKIGRDVYDVEQDIYHFVFVCESEEPPHPIISSGTLPENSTIQPRNKKQKTN